MLELSMYIDGKWITSISKEKREVKNPANGELLAVVADGTAEDAQYAISVARSTFNSGIWSQLPFKTRAKYLHKIANLLEEEADDLAMLETLNSGKMFTCCKNRCSKCN